MVDKSSGYTAPLTTS